MAVTTLDHHLHRFCGGRYQAAAETVTVRLSGMQAHVARDLFRCTKCGDEQRTVEQRDAAERLAVEQMRAEHGLLAPREIRRLRETLGLTPTQLGELLYGVPKGVVEGWERGRYLQNRAADALLRSLADRETRERRAARAGVVLPAPVEAGEGDVVGTAPGTAEAGTNGSAGAGGAGTWGNGGDEPQRRGRVATAGTGGPETVRRERQLPPSA